MEKSIRFVGLDVHGDSIVCAVIDAERVLLSCPNTEHSVVKLMRRLEKGAPFRVCYEAGLIILKLPCAGFLADASTNQS